MTTKNLEKPRKRARKKSRIPYLLVFGGLLLLLGWLVLQALPVWRAGRALMESQAKAESMMAGGFTDIDPDEAEAFIIDVHGNVEIINQKVGPLLPIAAKLEWLPKVGPLLAVGPELMTMADAGSDSAYFAVKGLKPALSTLQDADLDGNQKIPQLLSNLDDAELDLIQASTAFDRLIEARDYIDNVEELPWRIRTAIEIFDEKVPIAEVGFALAPVLPELMGLNEEMSYLLIAQNEDELRATGGFISGAGLLNIKDGAVSSLTFEDGNVVDDWRNKPYDLPPQPLQDFMNSELFLFRDANFWPDFPVSAEQAMELYTYSKEVPLDGAIAIDQVFLTFLLDAVGPIYSNELDLQITANSVINQLRSEWEPEENEDSNWWRSRKDFMGPLANALMAKLISDFDSIDPVHLSNKITEAADQKHLQIYIRDDEIASSLAEIGWDGRQEVSESIDFLQIVDSNMGFNKANALVEREISYAVYLQDEGRPQADLNVVYFHSGTPGITECQQGLTAYDPTTITYNTLVNDCYWNYARVYVPGGSDLISSSSHPLSADFLLSNQPWDGEVSVTDNSDGLLTVFDTFFGVQPGQQVTLSLNYDLPDTIINKIEEEVHYKLLVQKQAGTIADSLSVEVTVPPNLKLAFSKPIPDNIDGNLLTFQTDLTSDQEFELIFSSRSEN